MSAAAQGEPETDRRRRPRKEGATPGGTGRAARDARVTLEQLRVFVAVAEREHLTQAARALRIAQSAVSASVAALEAEFAVALFDRVGRGLRLTPSGAVLLAEAQAVLRRVDQARERVKRFSLDLARRGPSDGEEP